MSSKRWEPLEPEYVHHIYHQAKKEETIFTVYTPPHVGFYKLEIYASRVPKTTGKINLPLVATFMLEVKLKMTTVTSGH